MYLDKELLLHETEEIFRDNKKLEGKLECMRDIIRRVRDTIKSNEDVHVSFGVYESFNRLSDTEVKSFRMLECLKIVRTGF